MRKISTILLQGIIVLIGVSAFAFMLWEPTIEGRNAHATLFEVYFKDPFLAYAYATSILFFVALYQVFRVLGCVRQHEAYSQATLRAVRTIKYCAIALVALVAAPVAYLFITRPGDDIAGGVAMGVFIILVAIIMTTIAVVFEQRGKNAMEKIRESLN